MFGHTDSCPRVVRGARGLTALVGTAPSRDVAAPSGPFEMHAGPAPLRRQTESCPLPTTGPPRRSTPSYPRRILLFKKSQAKPGRGCCPYPPTPVPPSAWRLTDGLLPTTPAEPVFPSLLHQTRHAIMDPPDGPPVAEPSRHQAGVAGRQTMASGTAHGSGDDRSAQQQQPLHCAGSAAGTASDPSSALGQWPKQYSYMCGGLFKPQAANTAEAARQPDHQDDDEDKGNCEEGEDEDEDERQLYDPGGKVYYLTRRAEAISPVQDAQLRGTAGLFCRDGINDEDAEEGDCLDDLAEAYPLEFFPWPVCSFLLIRGS